jgi:hypothetical protein
MLLNAPRRNSTIVLFKLNKGYRRRAHPRRGSRSPAVRLIAAHLSATRRRAMHLVAPQRNDWFIQYEGYRSAPLRHASPCRAALRCATQRTDWFIGYAGFATPRHAARSIATQLNSARCHATRRLCLSRLSVFIRRPATRLCASLCASTLRASTQRLVYQFTLATQHVRLLAMPRNATPRDTTRCNASRRPATQRINYLDRARQIKKGRKRAAC